MIVYVVNVDVIVHVRNFIDVNGFYIQTFK